MNWNTAIKRLIAVFLSLLTLNYLFFLLTIWVDTGFELALIEEAYRDMSSYELIRHTYDYLQWFIYMFSIVIFLFWHSAYTTRFKLNLSYWSIFWIILDITSVWGMSHSLFFAKILYLSGAVLAITFIFLFASIQHQLWMKHD